MEERGTGENVGAFIGVQRERADLGAVFAGACVVLGVGIALLALGAAVGLSALDLTTGDWGGRATVVGGGVWSAFAIVLGTLAGGYTAVRLAGHYSRADAGAHGLATWALAFVATLAFTSAFGAFAAPAAPAPAASPGVTEVPSGGETETTPLADAVPSAGITPTTTVPDDAPARAGAWASWAFFATALLSAIAGILGGIWALPEPLRALARPGARVANRPLDG
jgi:hypothetical protein